VVLCNDAKAKETASWIDGVGHEQVGLTKSNAAFSSCGLQAKRAILPQVPLMMMPSLRG